MAYALRPLLALMAGVSLLSCGSSGSTSFAKPGISTVVITAIPGMTSSRAQAVAIQADHNVVAAGTAYNGSQNLFALARYKSQTNDNTDGQLDPTFNGTGIVTTAIGAVDDQAQALAVQSADQKLVAAGFSYDGSQYVFALARYNTDGSPDTSFNGGDGSNTTGTIITPIGTIDDRAFAVTIQSDDKIVAAGYSSQMNGSSIQSRVALVRYNTDGSLDATFNPVDHNGIVIIDSSTYFSSSDPAAIIYSAQALTLVTQSDGGEEKLVAAGYAYRTVPDGDKTRKQNEFLLVRIHSNGSPDAGFNGGDASNISGMVTTAIGTGYGNDEVYALAVDINGKLVAAGSSYVTQGLVAVVRYNSDGSLDTTFNTTGKVTTTINTDGGAAALRMYTNDQSVEQLVIAGTGFNNTYGEFILARYNPDGHLDKAFGSGGKVDTAILYGAGAFGLAIDSDGSPVAAGFSHGYFNPPPQPQAPDQFTLVRYTTAGKVDTTFPTQP
jgi:uncharacterized delta-60 repeat protein